MKTVLILTIATVLFSTYSKDKPIKLSPEKFISIKVPEPSDICFSSKDNSYFIVSDNGFLFHVDSLGNILKKADFEGIDFEGVYLKDGKVYVVNESMRKVHRFDMDSLVLEETYVQTYGGGRNKGYESITFNEATKHFVMFTEKDPIYIHEYDESFNRIKEFEFKEATDISSATWHDGYLWVLSDEDMMIFQLNPTTYKVIQKWYIPVLNPEGITFNNDNNIIISSDDMERLYFFNNPVAK